MENGKFADDLMKYEYDSEGKLNKMSFLEDHTSLESHTC